MFTTLPPVRRPEVKPMSEGEAALQEEISKVRERTRLQALAQGVPPPEAEARAATAVEEFCAKWGLRPEAAAPAPPLPAPAPPVRAPAPPAPQRSVDLGSSPLRSPTASGDRTQSIRISEILKKGREGATSPSSNPAIPVPPSLAAPPAAPGAKPSLASVLRRHRSGGLQGESAAPATVTIPIASAAAAAPRSPVLS
ncbi:MAG: hypothetical protein L6R43_20160, partial [Planctomycetes bacterium]|nr:hypothetical protein [Planctomycetota bacterium]